MATRKEIEMLKTLARETPALNETELDYIQHHFYSSGDDDSMLFVFFEDNPEDEKILKSIEAKTGRHCRSLIFDAGDIKL